MSFLGLHKKKDAITLQNSPNFHLPNNFIRKNDVHKILIFLKQHVFQRENNVVHRVLIKCLKKVAKK